jgi:hypothetical protein
MVGLQTSLGRTTTHHVAISTCDSYNNLYNRIDSDVRRFTPLDTLVIIVYGSTDEVK